MRSALQNADVDACVEHDINFHRSILKASQNDFLLRVWDSLALDLRMRMKVEEGCDGVGLTPASVRRVTELVQKKIEDDLTLDEMAESAGLSAGYFSQMFRKSTGETPHQFLLRHRIERAKEMLRDADTRVLDVAVACGFKTQQHFARVFRRMCGTSPT